MKWIEIAALSLAILFGGSVAYFNEISLYVFTSNIFALIVGSSFILFGVSIYDFIQKNISYFSCIVLGLLGLTLYFQGYESVRRWIVFGPVQLNVSLVLAPILLLALARLKSREAMLTGIIAGTIYFFQPDFSQAIAFGISAVLILTYRKDFTNFSKMMSYLFFVIIVIATWFQTDTLPAIPHVEQILHLGFAQGPFFMVGGSVCIFLLFLPLVLTLKNSRLVQKRVFVSSLLAYWVLGFISTEFGKFPVPVIGAGAAGVLGFSLTYVLIFGFEPDDSASNISNSF